MDEHRVIHVRIPIAFWNAIIEDATKRGQTPSAEIRRLLYEHYNELMESKI